MSLRIGLAFRACSNTNVRVVTQVGSRCTKRLPALKTGDLYKTHSQQGRTIL
jgi:hypothetical protein